MGQTPAPHRTAARVRLTHPGIRWFSHTGLRSALVAVLVFAMPLAGLAGDDGVRYVRLPGGTFRSALQYEDVKGAPVRIAPFELMQRPVTNAEFLVFVKRHPEWQRGRIAKVFAEQRYLSHWAGPTTLGPRALPDQPVTWVSWFAANAYCEDQGARLPTWNKWEFAAAANERRTDARRDPAWRRRILAWYSRPSNETLPRAGLQPPNAWGVQDLHGLVWEWTDDYSALLVSSDNREQGDADKLRFCGAGAISMDDRENYAVLMRVAMLSALDGADTTANLGFRCARSATP